VKAQLRVKELLIAGPGTQQLSPHTTMPSSLLLVTALTFFLASSFVLTRGDHASQHSLHEPRVLHCLSRSAVRSLQFCLCLNDLDLEFFYTVSSSVRPLPTPLTFYIPSPKIIFLPSLWCCNAARV
jgi:hypothetical protein